MEGTRVLLRIIIVIVLPELAESRRDQLMRAVHVRSGERQLSYSFPAQLEDEPLGQEDRSADAVGQQATADRKVILFTSLEIPKDCGSWPRGQPGDFSHDRFR